MGPDGKRIRFNHLMDLELLQEIIRIHPFVPNKHQSKRKWFQILSNLKKKTYIFPDKLESRCIKDRFNYLIRLFKSRKPTLRKEMMIDKDHLLDKVLALHESVNSSETNSPMLAHPAGQWEEVALPETSTDVLRESDEKESREDTIRVSPPEDLPVQLKHSLEWIQRDKASGPMESESSHFMTSTQLPLSAFSPLPENNGPIVTEAGSSDIADTRDLGPKVCFTAEMDLHLVQEILCFQPFGVQSGAKWLNILNGLKSKHPHLFPGTLTTWGIMDRFHLLAQDFKDKNATNQASSGISEEKKEIDRYLQEAIEVQNLCDMKVIRFKSLMDVELLREIKAIHPFGLNGRRLKDKWFQILYNIRKKTDLFPGNIQLRAVTGRFNYLNKNVRRFKYPSSSGRNENAAEIFALLSEINARRRSVPQNVCMYDDIQICEIAFDDEMDVFLLREVLACQAFLYGEPGWRQVRDNLKKLPCFWYHFTFEEVMDRTSQLLRQLKDEREKAVAVKRPEEMTEKDNLLNEVLALQESTKSGQTDSPTFPYPAGSGKDGLQETSADVLRETEDAQAMEDAISGRVPENSTAQLMESIEQMRRDNASGTTQSEGVLSAVSPQPPLSSISPPPEKTRPIFAVGPSPASLSVRGLKRKADQPVNLLLPLDHKGKQSPDKERLALGWAELELKRERQREELKLKREAEEFKREERRRFLDLMEAFVKTMDK